MRSSQRQRAGLGFASSGPAVTLAGVLPDASVSSSGKWAGCQRLSCMELISALEVTQGSCLPRCLACETQDKYQLPKKGRKRGIKLKSCCRKAPHRQFLSHLQTIGPQHCFMPSASSWGVHVCVLSRVQLFVTPWTVAHQVPLSMGFSRQGQWSGLPFPPPGDLPHAGIKPTSPVLADGFSRHSHLSHHQFPSPPPTWQENLPPLGGFQLVFPPARCRLQNTASTVMSHLVSIKSRPQSLELQIITEFNHIRISSS